ncbi:MAG TPA: hypothetical protein VFJ74_16695, partial [Gemmatimonadaceae bacterium]|nr:hypothetical protein [Gemmatimonadaceae bacterium]
GRIDRAAYRGRVLEPGVRMTPPSLHSPSAARRTAATLGLCVAALAVPTRPARSQARVTTSADSSALRGASPRQFRQKDPRVALLLGTLYPGAGHHYAGEHVRAVLYSAAALTPILVGVANELTVNWKGMSCAFSPNCTFASDREIRRARVERNLALVAGVSVWAVSAWDAPRAARRTNERRVNGSRSSLVPAVGLAPSGALYAGVSTRF